MSKSRWACAGLIALVSVACAGPAVVAESPGLEGTSWTLASLDGRVTTGPPVVTAQFAADRIAGSDGCNRYVAAYQAGTGQFSVTGSVAGTQMACAPEIMERARAFQSALARARAYRISDGQLELLGADGAVLAALAAQSQSLAGTSWRVTAINNGKQAVVSVAQDTHVTIAFDDSNRVAGSTGCNRYTASYRADGASLQIAPAATTRMACPQPGVMEQERLFLAALATVNAASIEGDRLELRASAGALAISAVRGD